MYKSGSGYVEYNENQLQQMIGRAGRPQFGDTTAKAGSTKILALTTKL